MLAALLCGAVIWFQMSIGRETGGAVHHMVLIWPIPQFLIVSLLAYFPRAALPFTVAMALANLSVIAQYHEEWRQRGTPTVWTDATPALVARLSQTPGRITAADWGIFEPVQYYTRGKRPIDSIGYEFRGPEMAAGTRPIMERIFRSGDTLFVSHVAAQEVFAGNHDRFDTFARKLGRRRVTEYIVPDSRGRPVFEVFRFRE